MIIYYPYRSVLFNFISFFSQFNDISLMWLCHTLQGERILIIFCHALRHRILAIEKECILRGNHPCRKDNNWRFQIATGSSLSVTFFCLPSCLYRKCKWWSFSADMLCVTLMAFFFFSYGFQVPSPVRLTCSAARAPMLVCLDTGCVMVKGTVRMEAMSSPQQDVVWNYGTVDERKLLQHPQTFAFVVLTIFSFTLTFPIPGLIGSIRIRHVGCCHHSSSATFLTTVQIVSLMHSGIIHF